MVLNYRLNVTCGVIPHRMYVCILCFLGLTMCYIMRFCIAIAITEMCRPIKTKVDPHACPVDSEDTNASASMNENKLDWSEEEQGLVLSSFFWGYAATQIPGGLISDRIGPRRVILLSVLLTSLFTVLSPLAALHGGKWGLISARILLGLAQGWFYASLHTVVAIWVPTEELGLWGTLVFSGAHIGNFIQNLASGFMLAAFRPNWMWVFYIWGSLGVIWTVLFFFTTWDNYNQIPDITEKEKGILDAYYEKISKKKKAVATPWKKIFLSFPVWAINLGMVGHDWGTFTLVVDIPKFMKSVLQFDVKRNGTLVAMGYLALCIVGYSSGWLVDFIDKKKWMSRTLNRKVFTTIASVGPTVGLLACSYTAKTCNRALAVFWLILGMCTMGTFYPSLKVNPIDLAPNHAGVIGAVSQTGGALSGILVPYLIGIMTPDSTWSQWNWVWWVTLIVMSVTNIFYVIFASAEVQPWNVEGVDAES